MTAKESKKKNSFADSYKKLDEIVRWFEKDGFDLEEGIEKFEEGQKLVKELREYLGSMENKIKELKNK